MSQRNGVPVTLTIFAGREIPSWLIRPARLGLPIGLFFVSLIVYLLTMPPSIYNLDSAEFATGAHVLGIVHAPGYPLYLVIAHLFTQLPVGDIGTRVNLFSVFSLAMTIPVLYELLRGLTQSQRVATTSSLVFGWSYYVWANGIVAEVYAPQILSLAILAWLLFLLQRANNTLRKRIALAIGVWFGLCVALNPSSVFFAPGLVVAFYVIEVPMRVKLVAGLTSVVTFGISLLYFPLRANANPVLNLAGQYDPNGVFQGVDLHSIDGIWWLISGQQFNRLFFAEGFLPSFNQIGDFVYSFSGNFLGIGIALGIVGLIDLFRRQRQLAWIWVVFAGPYAYFYLTYGATDREMMLGPLYLLWTIVMAIGIKVSISSFKPRFAWLLLICLPLLMLVVNFSLLDLSEDNTREQAEAILQDLPEDSVVLGLWWDIVSVEYLQKVEHKRPDLELYNMFLFDQRSLTYFVLSQTSCDAPPLYFLGDYVFDYIDSTPYQIDCESSDRYQAQICHVQQLNCSIAGE